MFERLTNLSRRVVVIAQQEARDLNHNYIGTEHLLLGMLRVEQGIAFHVLTQQGVDTRKVITAIPEFSPLGMDPPQGHIPFTVRNKRSLEYSLRETLRFGETYIDTEHLLLGVLRQAKDYGEPSVASRVLQKLNVSLFTLEQAVLTMRQLPQYSPPYVILSDELEILRAEKGAESPDFKLALARFFEKNARRLRKEAKSAPRPA